MAGSHSQPPSPAPFADPILAARLEALKQLADGMTDRVAVMDRDQQHGWCSPFRVHVGPLTKPLHC